jgi:hypothetical protein
MNCIRTFTPTNSSTICVLQLVGCDWAQILLLCPKTDVHCALSLVLGGSALTIVAIGGRKPVNRFCVLAEDISVFIRRTLFASRSMFWEEISIAWIAEDLNQRGCDYGGHHFGWRSPWWREAFHALFSGVPWHLSYIWGKLQQTLVIVPV